MLKRSSAMSKKMTSSSTFGTSSMFKFSKAVGSFASGSLIALLGCTAVQAGGLYLYEVATPDMGLAGAGQAANASDASTAFANPAGMVLLRPQEALIGIQPSFGTLNFQPNNLTNIDGNNGGEAGLDIPSGAFYYAGQFADCAWWGLSLNSYAGLGVDYDLGWVGRYYIDRSLLLTYNINPSIAYAMNEWFSLGGGVSLQGAYMNQKSDVRNLLDLRPEAQMKLHDTTWSWGYNIGLIFQIDLQKRIGLSYRSKIKQTFRNVFNLEGVGPLFADALNSRGFLHPDVDITSTFPEQVMLSLHYGMGCKLALMADWGWQHWAQYGTQQILIASTTPTSISYNLHFHDTWHYALGFSYKISNRYKWTAGIAYDSSPVSAQDRTIALPLDRQWRYATGFQWQYCPEVNLGFAYELMEAGSAPLDQSRGILTGRLAGDFSHNYVQFINVTASWKS